MKADPNCPRCHGVGYFVPASRGLGRGLVCTCRVKNGKVSVAAADAKSSDFLAVEAERKALIAILEQEADKMLGKANADGGDHGPLYHAAHRAYCFAADVIYARTRRTAAPAQEG